MYVFTIVTAVIESVSVLERLKDVNQTGTATSLIFIRKASAALVNGYPI